MIIHLPICLELVFPDPAANWSDCTLITCCNLSHHIRKNISNNIFSLTRIHWCVKSLWWKRWNKTSIVSLLVLPDYCFEVSYFVFLLKTLLTAAAINRAKITFNFIKYTSKFTLCLYVLPLGYQVYQIILVASSIVFSYIV